MTLFLSQQKRPHCVQIHMHSILLTLSLPDSFLNMGQGFTFILRCHWESLNYLSLSWAVSGETVDLVKQLERGASYMQIASVGCLVTTFQARTLIQDHDRGYNDEHHMHRGTRGQQCHSHLSAAFTRGRNLSVFCHHWSFLNQLFKWELVKPLIHLSFINREI